MSARGDQFLFEIAAAAKYFSVWVCENANRSVLATAINTAVAEYERQRTDRVHTLGVPVFNSPSLPAGEAPVEPTPPVLVQEQDTAALSVARVTETVSHAVTTAASTALNYVRFFGAVVADKWLSNSADKFKEKFPVVELLNAQLAFMYVGQLSNGWAPENHGGIGRASLSTLILVGVLDEFVKLRASDVPLAVGRDGSDEDDDVIDVDWVQNVKTGADHDLPKLDRFLSCYRSKEGINPLVLPEQAKQIFVAFAATESAAKLSVNLAAYLEQQLRAAKPSARM
ncbi:MAG: hypothetical protein A3F13_06495 [Gammaproteobacteria bacterium RIFCSPHIGHO2_12_FULL_40_19]|nr:MAG: hypothetical protein A3F13_06495 [Gammaproteobacteria bacterium RIFCSPHIGHO2_12_FULL_40_19]